MKEILKSYIKRFVDIDDIKLEEVTKNICVRNYKKGFVLIQQGEIPKECYFVLNGCVRQYFVDECGKEITNNFFTKEQSITIFTSHSENKSSKYSLNCIEDCMLVVGKIAIEEDMFNTYPILETITRKIFEVNLGKINDEFANFISSKPEDRFIEIQKNRPELLYKVPQHQLASYLGITPESLCRIKNRFKNKTKD